jgi:protein-S-isoprenylcysteine O-methyltransferase Ste14
VNILGIGPLLAIVGGSSLAIVLLLQRTVGIGVSLLSPWRELFQVLGIVLLALGVYFWLSAAVLIARAFRSHRLETSGVYRLSRNPLYAAFIVFLVPGIAFMCNDLLIFVASVAMFVVFKLRIRKEEEFLQQEFGADFQQYAREVAQLIPFVRV